VARAARDRGACRCRAAPRAAPRVNPGAKKDLERKQRRWAEATGVVFDARGYVRDEAANLWRPLSAGAIAGFARGSERAPRATAPPRMTALCSSAALVANVFDHWTARDAGPLLRALGFEEPRATIAFEEPLATGLEGDAPTADVFLTLPADRAVAIESKFSEWLVRRPRNKVVFKAKYFPSGRAPWEAHGLPRCQALAAEIQSGAQRFRFLHAAQLLKHALGLASTRPAAFELRYLYYEWPTREAEEHRGEIERFAAAVDREVPFAALTYQTLFAKLDSDPRVDRGYLDYLRARYFPDQSRVGAR
jgi:restriction endonuclease-like protein